MGQTDARLAAHSGLSISAAGFRETGTADCVADGRRQAVARRGRSASASYRLTTFDFSRASASSSRTPAAF